MKMWAPIPPKKEKPEVSLFIGEIMTRNVITASPSTSVADVARLMRDKNIGSVVVMENGRIAGIVTERDIVTRYVANPMGKRPEEIVIGEIMTRNPITIRDNVEIRKGDGGRIARRSGAYAVVFSHEGNNVILRLPSRKEKVVSAENRATIGIVAGGGRMEKPFLKAGIKYYRERVHPKRWPVVRGVAMNPVSHPHGGGSHKRPGKPTTVARGAPPGRKVGHIAARKTGRGKKRAGIVK